MATLNFESLFVDDWGELLLMKCKDNGISEKDGYLVANISIEFIELGSVPIYG
jgi:hypothetical protein